MAFKTGLSQMFVVVILELVNMIFMLKDDAISDIVMNFTALLIISDFDDYLYVTIENTPMGQLCKNGEIEAGGGKITLEDVLRIESTTSKRVPPDHDTSVTKTFDDGQFQVVGREKDQYASLRSEQQRIVFKFAERSCFNKFCRVIYKILNIIYQAIWFYFAPFAVFILSYMLPYWLGGFGLEEAGAEEEAADALR